MSMCGPTQDCVCMGVYSLICLRIHQHLHPYPCMRGVAKKLYVQSRSDSPSKILIYTV